MPSSSNAEAANSEICWAIAGALRIMSAERHNPEAKLPRMETALGNSGRNVRLLGKAEALRGGMSDARALHGAVAMISSESCDDHGAASAVLGIAMDDVAAPEFLMRFLMCARAEDPRVCVDRSYGIVWTTR